MQLNRSTDTRPATARELRIELGELRDLQSDALDFEETSKARTYGRKIAKLEKQLAALESEASHA